MRGGFWLNTETHFILGISNNDQWKEKNLFRKTLLWIFKIAFRLRDLHLFMCELLQFKQLFFTFNFDVKPIPLSINPLHPK